VLRVFADTVLHIPEHRRLVLFHKILATLGPEHSLWLFLCLVLEEHVIHSQEERMSARQQDWGELPPRQEFALNLAISWPPVPVIVTCIKLVKYIQSLPVEKGKLFKHSDDCWSVTHPLRVGNGVCLHACQLRSGNTICV
jgi:U3 small nucleolar RNA-associated protein 10